MPPRRPRPDLVDRATVEAMIAEAVAAERERQERDLVGVVLALSRIGEDLDVKTAAILDVRQVLHRHADVLGPMADAFAALCGLTEAAGTVPSAPLPN